MGGDEGARGAAEPAPVRLGNPALRELLVAVGLGVFAGAAAAFRVAVANPAGMGLMIFCGVLIGAAMARR